MKYFLIFLCVFFAGCTETRSERQAETDKSDTITVRGTAHAPGLGAMPIDFIIERSGTESLREQGVSKTQIDVDAIAAKVSDVVGKSISAALASLTGGMVKPGFSGVEGGLLGGLGGMALLAGREWMARKREEKALIEVKGARNQAQADALDLAKRLPPV